MQVWQTDELGGYMYADNLSEILRTAVQPLIRFRQFCDVRAAKGYKKGQTFNWNAYSDTEDEGRVIQETEEVPQTNYTISQNSLTVKRYGMSVPFSELLDDLSEHPVKEVITQVLKNDCRRVLDKEAWKQFKKTPLKVTSSSATGVNFQTGGTAGGTHTHGFSAEATLSHAKWVVDTMTERDIPTYDGTNYIALSRPRNLRSLKDHLEGIHKYTVPGWNHIMNGEKGRYEGIRYIEQTNVSKVAAANSDDIFFFGADTVIEAVVCPEEIRGKIPTNFGFSRAIMWYALLGFGINHTQSDQARVLHWTATDA